ncbi:Rho termination factor N-terminal domain-containing protein [Clostridium perfringens]|nr:Rho termination factor N-terminal domain-containing protein [Clostridium perfringens]
MFRMKRLNVERVVDNEHSKEILEGQCYTVIEDNCDPLENADYDALKVEDLKALAAEKGIEVPSKTKKEDIIQLIKDSE